MYFGGFMFGFVFCFDDCDLFDMICLCNFGSCCDCFCSFCGFCVGKVSGGVGVVFFFGFLCDDDLVFLVGDFEFVVFGDFGIVNIVFVCDFRGVDGFFVFDLCGFGFMLGFFVVLGDFGFLGGFEGFDFFFLLNVGFFFVVDDLEFFVFCFYCGVMYGDIGFCINCGLFFF